jgi:UDP-3-O-[3-hydroxymyristoyl] N-acetylglucosamine deacetylase
MLDAIGDLTLAGAPLLGAYRTVHGGHKVNYAALTALMADPSAWCLSEAEAVLPARSQADLPGALPAAAYAPDVS